MKRFAALAALAVTFVAMNPIAAEACCIGRLLRRVFCGG